MFNALSMWNYNINICNISHIYFYLCEKELGYISINDFDNFVVFDFPNMYIDELVNMLNSVKENAEICFEYKYDIDGIVEDDLIPIGIEKKW